MEQIAQLREVIPQIRRTGTEIAVLGNGSSEQAEWFRSQIGRDIPVYTDPDLTAYRKVGAKRNLRGILHPRVFLRAWQARRAGHKQSGVQGDAMQQGGVFLIMSDGAMPYAYYGQYAGDHPEPESVLAAVAEHVRS
jgi:hypothetical protein